MGRWERHLSAERLLGGCASQSRLSPRHLFLRAVAHVCCTCDAGTSEPAGASTEVERASEMEGVRLRRWAVGQPLPMDEDWQPAPGKWALSERELEMINLGSIFFGILLLLPGFRRFLCFARPGMAALVLARCSLAHRRCATITSTQQHLPRHKGEQGCSHVLQLENEWQF